jgi:biopolymer transport protein ExbB
MQQTLGFSHFLHQADGIAAAILIFMLIMSTGTWYVIVTKTISSTLSGRTSRLFLDQFWKAPSLEDVHELVKNGSREPFSRLVNHGLEASSVQRSPLTRGFAVSEEDYVVRSLKRSIEDDALHLEKGLTFLATVASSAPFVGLFGTVWGIYNALMTIGLSGQGTLDKVAGPVGEALIMTGIGLVVAIPAAISYNVFSRRNRSVLGKLDSFAHDVFTLLSRGVKVQSTIRSGGI